MLLPRDVPLGGIRAITVRRTLPHIDRTTVGPWAFLDHYGPTTTPMDVGRHPHCGLSTISWLFDGEIRHNDSAGYHETIKPGDGVMMTAGSGISTPRNRFPTTSTARNYGWCIPIPNDTARKIYSATPRRPNTSGQLRYCCLWAS